MLLTSFIIVLLTPISDFYLKYGLIYLTLDLFLLSVAPLSKKHKNKSLYKYFIGMFIGALLISLIVLLLLGLRKIDLVLNDNINLTIILSISLFWILQSFFEEYLLRGILYRCIAKILGSDFSIVITALIFSLFHIGNNNISILPLVNVFIFGMLCGYLVKIYKNIFLVSGLHFIWNYFQGNLFGIEVSGSSVRYSIYRCIMNKNALLFNGGNFGIEGGIIATLVLLVATIFFLVLSFKKKKTNEVYYLYKSLDLKFVLSKEKNRYVYHEENKHDVMDLYAQSLLKTERFILLKDIKTNEKILCIDISTADLSYYEKILLLEQWDNASIELKFIGGNYFIKSSLEYEFNN